MSLQAEEFVNSGCKQSNLGLRKDRKQQEEGNL
jgi:hypothetical protein